MKNKMLNIHRLLGSFLLSMLFLSGCTAPVTKVREKKESNSSSINFTNIKSNKKVFANKHGVFFLVGTAPKGTLIDASYKTDLHFKKRVNSSKKFKIKIDRINFYDSGEKDGLLTVVKAKNPDGKSKTIGFYLYSQFASMSKSKDKPSQNIKHNNSKKVQVSSGEALSILKKSIEKSLKDNDSLIFNYTISVKGMDYVKPYIANIIVKDNKDSQESCALATPDIIRGIKNINYQDYSNIKITFESNLVNQYGNKVKNDNILSYNFKKSTLDKINNPNSLTPSDLKNIANDYYKRPLKK